MTAIVNRAASHVSESNYCHRQIENDLPTKKDGRETLAQRVCKIAVPLLMLYRPIAKPLSIGMGGLRVATHLFSCVQAKQKRDRWKLAAEGTQAGLALLSFASCFVQFRLGSAIT